MERHRNVLIGLGAAGAAAGALGALLSGPRALLPVAAAGDRVPPRAVAWVSLVVGLALLANAIASNVRDREAAAAVFGRTRALRAAAPRRRLRSRRRSSRPPPRAVWCGFRPRRSPPSPPFVPASATASWWWTARCSSAGWRSGRSAEPSGILAA